MDDLVTEIKVEENGFSSMRVTVAARGCGRRYSHPRILIDPKAGPGGYMYTDENELQMIINLVKEVEDMVNDVGGVFE